MNEPTEQKLPPENDLLRVEQGYAGIAITRKAATDPRAELAMELIKSFGLVACKPADPTGCEYQRLEMMTEEEVVTRACKLAALAFPRFEDEGWMISIPPNKEPR